MAALGEDDPLDMDAVTATQDTSPEITVPHQRLAALEEDNATLRATCAALQAQLDQVKNAGSVASSTPVSQDDQSRCGDEDRCSQCDVLRQELKMSQFQCEELKCFQHQLEQQTIAFQLQKEQFEAKEKDLTCEIKSLQEKLNQTDTTCETTDSYVPSIKTDQMPDLPVVTVLPEQTQAPSCDSSELPANTDSTHHAQQLLQQCQCRLKELEKENKILQEQCSAAEIEKTTLRTNIRKVSANWFERKTRLSDSDSESPHNGEGLCLHQDSSCEREEAGVQVPEFVPEKYSLHKKMEDVPRLLAELSYVTGKLDLTERMCNEIKRRVKDYETVIDDQEIIIHGLKDQLDTYFNDNQKMSEQLRILTKLFEDLELTEKTKVNSVTPPDNNNTVFSTLPSEQDFKEMSHSVSKTYTKLKELIMEKKSLVTEIERLKVLNVELQRRVTQQENRLSSVAGALHSTWLLVSDMKEQHAQLHSSESILRYELKGKRELLHRLREELECSREQWHKIRQMNSESEEAWRSLNEELNERRRMANKVTSPNSDGTHQDEIEGATAATCPSNEFEPPVDLLLDMAIEYGVIDADDEASTAMVAAMEGEDMHASRLHEMEEQCSYLYQKLMASTARSLTLASRLSALHQHYGSSDEDEDDDDDDDDDIDDDYDNDYDEFDNTDIHNFDTHIHSPEPESSDTAYMSEADSGSGTSGLAGSLSEEEGNATGGSADEAFTPIDESADVEGDLSKRLINFLPKKIEILSRDNKRLEERCRLLQEEKNSCEAHLTEALDKEHRLRQVLEAKLEHLGKIVDELKLERNGKITEAEEKLKQKVASLNEQENKYENLQDEVDGLKEQLEERGQLLHIASSRVTELEVALKTQEVNYQDALGRLKQTDQEVNKLQSAHTEINQENEALKKDVETLHVQLADLRFQMSSKDMECDAAIKADQQKLTALSASALQISEQEAKINHLEQQAATDKATWLQQQENLSSMVEKLQEDIKEKDTHTSSLGDQLQQSETKLKATQSVLIDTQGELKTTQENSSQISSDNEQLREKIIQLLSRRVRVCDDCFSVQAELAAIVATTPSSSWHTDDESQEQTTKETQASGYARSLPITTKQPNDDDYAVISDDEVQSSRLSSSPSSGSPSIPEVVPETRATADILTFSSLSSQPPTNCETWVGAGTRSLMPVELPAGVILQWNFISEPKCVSFSVLHQPPLPSSQAGEEGASSNLRVLIPTTRVATTQGSTVKGRLVTKQPGVYTLVFDNSSSRYTAKKITYSLTLLSQGSGDSLPQQPSPSSSSLPAP